MTKRIIPPTPEKTVYLCNRCGREDFKPKVEAMINLQDFQGNHVAGEEVHLCLTCGLEFLKWMEST